MTRPSATTRFARCLALTALVVIAIDQISKAIVVRTIDQGESVPVIDGVLRFVHYRNPGIAGGHLADAPTAAIVALTTASLVGLLLLVRSLGPRKLLWLPAGLLLGGGLGNLLDRVRTGAVTDFIVFRDSGPANLADQAITVGIVGLLIVAWFSHPARAPQEPAAQGPPEPAPAGAVGPPER